MFIQQIYTNCLAHAAYYIESGKEAVVIDPLRNPEPYMALATERGARIKYVLETHFHADFVSGHIDLANQTGATIIFGPKAKPEYKAYIAEDGEILNVGPLKIKVLYTPGHTIESTCYLLYDERGKEYAVFTGDTLFVGNVGRPDLLSGNLNKEELAGFMYESLQTKIKPLAGDVIVYPGHGAGSACGKSIGIESFSTIGHEKKFNYAMRTEDKTSFIKAVTTDLPGIPGYFFKDAGINKNGYAPYSEVLEKNLRSLTIEQFTSCQKGGAFLLDTRSPINFAAGFIHGSLNVGLSGDFAGWVGTFVPVAASILLIAASGTEPEVVERLARIGYDTVDGYLEGGMLTWFNNNKSYDQVLTFSGTEVASLLEISEYYLLDVRNRNEAAKHRLTGSLHIPLSELKTRFAELEKGKQWLVYCAGGYRSMIAASFLKANGFSHVASIEGGINEIIQRSPQLLEMDAE